ncbi:hydroxyacid dehydrogenase [Brevibacterium permense]|uniref:phosphoglycerate dehydrogenase n=1 Tax=Brevibacterium permense TaxID=234834 RepID=UPI0021CFF759|nr:phosphoglycerate dehydrogenase [Brevibacterium permense]MCU4298639.1 hydroxyacid dehydrogenase [Brevibacterium permense]
MSNRIVITTDYLGEGDEVDRLLRSRGCEPVYAPSTLRRSPDEQAHLFDGAVAGIVSSEPITREMLAAAPTLKVVARSGVGYDSVDIAAAADLGITVCNTPGTNHHAVAELTLSLMLNCARRLTTVTRAVEEGAWPREAGTELRGKTLGVVGFGASGRAITSLGVALGMRVLVSTAHPGPSESPGIEFVDFDQVVSEADYLTLHARATGQPVIGVDQLAAMKTTAYLINTARGSLVDESALADALRHQRIAGTALDVLDREPMRDDDPLRGVENLWIISHLAGQTVEARQRSGLAAAEAVLAVLDGATPNGRIV